MNLLNYKNILPALAMLLVLGVMTFVDHFFSTLLFILFAALWDAGYAVMEIEKDYHVHKLKLNFYRVYQHCGIFLFVLSVSLLMNEWEYMAGYYLIQFSGIQDFVWHLIVLPDIPEDYQARWCKYYNHRSYWMQWTYLGWFAAVFKPYRAIEMYNKKSRQWILVSHLIVHSIIVTALIMYIQTLFKF